MQSTVTRKSDLRRQSNPLRTLAASRKISFVGVSSRDKESINRAIIRAEVGLCDYSATFSVSRELGNDFQAGSTEQIILSDRVFSAPGILCLHLRHAIELVLWFQMCSRKIEPVHSIAVALLAAFTARRFYLQMPPAERQQIAEQIPGWLRDSVESKEIQSEEQVLRNLSAHLSALMALQGESMPPAALIEEAIRIAIVYSSVANPTEFTLTLHGDERLLIDPATGLNKYGCSPRPRPEAITFSSCTASSVSEFAYCETEQLRHRLMRTLPQNSLTSAYEQEIEAIRIELRKLLDLERFQTDVVLSTSGTDAELFPLVLFCSPNKTRLVNIIIAPDEVGSGTVLAAGGRHFSSTTPHGAKVRRGDAVAGMDVGGIEVVCIPIRHPDGWRLSSDEIQQITADAVAEAAKVADKIILHIVDSTKTGLVVPDANSVLRLQEKYGDKLCVVVDACQFRLEKSNLHRYLAQGFCVIITGSKFFTGPPFCGAFLIPSEFNITRDGQPLPYGFADYFTRSEIPAAWQSQAHHLSSVLNLGLLFRWTGALHEMRCFYSVPPRRRTAILRSFRSELIESTRRNPDLHLLESETPNRWQDDNQSFWDAQPTIFSFAVSLPNHRTWLPISDLKTIYYWLNRDCTGQLPAAASEMERKLAAQRCHIGQPVTIMRCAETGETGALRIACGARLVYGITYDKALGKNPKERFHRELNDAQTVLAKVSLIVKYWGQFKPPGI